jgi:GAF domain-containing protein
MTLPLFARGTARGIVEVGSTRPRAYNPIDSAVFRQLVSQLSVAIENAEAYTQSRQLAMTKVTVNDISAKLSQHRDIEQLLNVTLTELGRALGARKGRIRLHINEPSEVVRHDAD